MSGFSSISDPIRSITKTTQGILDYDIDGGSWLKPGDAFLTTQWVSDPGISVGTTSHTDSKLKVWISGGLLGQSYFITVVFTTTQGRTDARTFRVDIVLRGD